MRKAPRSHASSAHPAAPLATSTFIPPLGHLAPHTLSTAPSLPMRDLGGTLHMIELKRLNGSPLAVNCDLIKYAEASPDTVLTLITGETRVALSPARGSHQ